MTFPLQDALIADASRYLKILKIDLNDDSFEMIWPNKLETDPSFNDKLSVWLKGFANTGQVHAEDIDVFRLNTDEKRIREAFKDGEGEFSFSYRRLIDEKHQWVNMKFIPAPEYTPDDPTLFLYVINLGRAVIDYEKKVQLLEEKLKENKLGNKLLASLSALYLTVHVIDLEEDTYEEYVSYFRLREFQRKSAKEQMKLVISHLISPRFVREALRFTDLSTLRERMGNRNLFYGEFLGNNVGWLRMSFLVLNKNEKGELKRVIFATRIVDDEKRRQQKLATRALEQFKKGPIM